MIQVEQTAQAIVPALAPPSAFGPIIPAASTPLDTDPHRNGLESVSDEELMRRMATGEQGALGQLYRRHYPLLRKIISERVSNVCDVEEVLQDVLVAVWNCVRSYDPAHGKPLGWVVCMARRRAIDHLRKNRRHQASHVPWGWCDDETDAVDHPSCCPLPAQDRSPAARDLRQCLIDLIGQLPAEQRRVLELAYFSDLSQRQISAQTGVPLGTIKTRLELAISKLAKKSEHLREDL